MNKADRQRLLHIQTYCADIAGFIQRFGRDYSIFISDRAYYNAVSMSILQIGELANGLSEEFRELTINAAIKQLETGRLCCRINNDHNAVFCRFTAKNMGQSLFLWCR